MRYSRFLFVSSCVRACVHARGRCKQGSSQEKCANERGRKWLRALPSLCAKTRSYKLYSYLLFGIRFDSKRIDVNN